MTPILPTSFLMLLLPVLCLSTPNSFQMPIYKRESPRLSRRGMSGSVGLGDFTDISYSVLVQVGDTQTPLVLDTGSSDLWVISDACKANSCASGVTLYPQASFQSANLDAKLFYGDSSTGTHAFGEVGKDIAGVAGLSIQNQFFAAINDTNTTVLQTGTAGIFGLGFPVNSVIWAQLFKAQHPTDAQPPTKRSNLRTTPFPDIPSLLGGSASGKRTTRALPAPSYRRTSFPDLASLLPSPSKSKRQTAPASTGPSLTDLLSTFATNGPLLARLAALSALPSPQFTITLQRDSVQLGGNVGMLSVGDLPPGVDNASLTWVPLRGYTAKQGGISSPTDVYPIAWEVPIDDVYLDGQKLPRSTLGPAGVELTALVDTGNSLVRGPQDVVQALMTTVTGSRTATTYNCAVPHTMSFQIGGKMFPVDPRDFVGQARKGNARDCAPNVVPTDPPHDGFLYSWSLGDPFLKSNLVSFYFGNLTHPSADPPRMGFMSTVQSNANDELVGAVSSAQLNGGNFPVQTEAAPSSNPSMGTTISGGVPQAAATSAVPTTNHESSSGAIRVHAKAGWACAVLGVVAGMWAW